MADILVTNDNKIRPKEKRKKAKKVIVVYRNQEHTFILTKNQSFENLLTESSRHWTLNPDDFELQDEDSSTLPLSGHILETLEFSSDEETDDFEPETRSTHHKQRIYLRPIDGYHPLPPGSPSSPRTRAITMVHSKSEPMSPLFEHPNPILAQLKDQHFSVSAPVNNNGTGVRVIERKKTNPTMEKNPLSMSGERSMSSPNTNAKQPSPEEIASAVQSSQSTPLPTRPQSPNDDDTNVDQHFNSKIKFIKCDIECHEVVQHFSELRIKPATSKNVLLKFESSPQIVLVVIKKDDPEVTECFKQVARWLKEEKKVQVVVEPHVIKQVAEAEDLSLLPFNKFETNDLDFVITMGGDGTVLYTNSLFTKHTPPIFAMHLGSLGFLSPFKFRNFKKTLLSVFQSESLLTLRSRLHCILVSGGTNRVETEFTVLNEVVIDRGSSPYLCDLECYCDGHKVTNVLADGIIISSATGSTAYSLSAGGSIVHPQVPAILFTPICPHSLSFRPLLFPDAVELRIQLPRRSRATAWASFDGRTRTEFKHEDYLIIKISKYPFVCINSIDTVGDWFKSLGDCLHWNDRQKQKAFVQTTIN
jgi:NAD+ kinase